MDLSFPQRIIDELGIPQLIDVRDKLPRNPKNNWADLAGFRNFGDLDTIGLHHDAYPKANRVNSTPMQMMTEIANEHIKNKSYDATGEGGIPYHIYIMRGQVYYCNEISWRTYGISGHNGHVVHVCVHGDYVNFDVLTDADRNCLIGVCLMLQQIEAMPNLKMIKGHKELSPTACPGYDYNRIRADVATWTNKFIYMDGAAGAEVRAFKIADQLLFLYNLSQGRNPDGSAADAGNIAWGKTVFPALFEIEPFMKERGLL